MNRIEQTICPMVLNQVGDYLGVSLGSEPVALSGQVLSQLTIVLDDPVMDHGQPHLAVDMRVRIHHVRAAMRRPARVRDSGMAMRWRCCDLRLELGDLADCLARLEPVSVDRRDSGRVIAAILETPQRGKKNSGRFGPTNVSNNAAHGSYSRV